MRHSQHYTLSYLLIALFAFTCFVSMLDNKTIARLTHKPVAIEKILDTDITQQRFAHWKTIKERWEKFKNPNHVAPEISNEEKAFLMESLEDDRDYYSTVSQLEEKLDTVKYFVP